MKWMITRLARARGTPISGTSIVRLQINVAHVSCVSHVFGPQSPRCLVKACATLCLARHAHADGCSCHHHHLRMAQRLEKMSRTRLFQGPQSREMSSSFIVVLGLKNHLFGKVINFWVNIPNLLVPSREWGIMGEWDYY